MRSITPPTGNARRFLFVRERKKHGHLSPSPRGAEKPKEELQLPLAIDRPAVITRRTARRARRANRAERRLRCRQGAPGFHGGQNIAEIEGARLRRSSIRRRLDVVAGTPRATVERLTRPVVRDLPDAGRGRADIKQGLLNVRARSRARSARKRAWPRWWRPAASALRDRRGPLPSA